MRSEHNPSALLAKSNASVSKKNLILGFWEIASKYFDGNINYSSPIEHSIACNSHNSSFDSRRQVLHLDLNY